MSKADENEASALDDDLDNLSDEGVDIFRCDGAQAFDPNLGRSLFSVLFRCREWWVQIVSVHETFTLVV